MTTPIPAAGYPSDSTRTQADMQTYFETMLSIAKEQLGGTGEAPAVQLSSNSFTPGNNACVCVIDTAGGASSDQLNTIQATNIRDGQVVFLRSASSSRVITIQNASGSTGQIFTFDGNNIILNTTKLFVALKYNAPISAFEELFRTGAGSSSGGITGAGDLPPIFSSTVTSQNLDFALSNAAPGSIFGNFTGASASPTYNGPGNSDQLLGVSHTGGGLEEAN